MKKRVIVCFLIIALIMSATVLPVHAKEAPFAYQWTYDNSFLVTITVDVDTPFPEEQLLDVVMYINMLEKQTENETCTYTVVCAKEQYFYAPYDWDEVAQQLEAFDFVKSVDRNPYSVDYSEILTHITLNQDEVRVGCGEQLELYVADKHLVRTFGFNVVGIEFVLADNAFDKIEEGCFADWGVQTFWAVPDDANKSEQGYYEGYPLLDQPGGFFDQSYLHATSPNNVYFGIQGDRVVSFWLEAFRSMVNAVVSDPRVLSAELIFFKERPIGSPEYEHWSIQNESIVDLVSINNQDPAEHTKCVEEEHRVIIQGKRKGTTKIRLEMLADDASKIFEIPVTVEIPDDYVFSVGDASMDGVVGAEDALIILRSTVNKIQCNEKQTQLADVDANQEVNSEDALLVLQKIVGKIEKFPCEE